MADAWRDGIEDYYAVKVLLVLLQDGRSARTAVYGKISKSFATAQKRVDRLIAVGLVLEHAETSMPGRKWVELTPRGIKVAEHLASIDRILEQT